MSHYLISLAVYCVVTWAAAIRFFKPEDNVANHTIRRFAPITLAVIGVAWTAGHVVRIVRVAPVMALGSVIVPGGVIALFAYGHGLAYVITCYVIGGIYLAVTRHRERRLNPISLQAAILSPLGMPILGLIALEELVRSRRQPKPAAADPAKPTNPPPQDG